MYNLPVRVLVSALALLSGVTLTRAEPGDTQKMLDKTFQTSAGALKYLLFVPKNYVATQKYPLVVSLRGTGSTYTEATNGNDQAHPWIQDSIQTRVPHFIMVPEPIGGTWGGPIGPGISDGILKPAAVGVIEAIEDLKKQYSLDTNRFIIAGFSLGGTGTYHMIEIKHNYWAAAVPASAGPDTTKLATIAKTPIWHHQGANDGTAGERMAKGLENRGHKVVRMVCEFNKEGAADWRAAIQQGGKPEDIIFKNAAPPVTVDSLRRAIAAGANFIYTKMLTGGHGSGWIGAAHNPLVATWAFSKVKGGTTVSLAPRVSGPLMKRNGVYLSYGKLIDPVDGDISTLLGQRVEYRKSFFENKRK